VTAIEEASSAAVLAALRDRGAGAVITGSDGRYEVGRRVWNGAINRRPLAVVRCGAVSEVAATVSVARQAGVPLAVRGGGHSLPGFSTCDGGIVLDLSGLRAVQVDAAARRARVGGGCTWAEFDTRAQEHGLATTGGLVSSTGVGGLTLGGGIGWLTRAHGLACDNLLAAELVTAAGAVVRASAQENPDLFWALRGGGGNFGVVTSFEFALHPVGDVTAVLLIWPYASAAAVAAAYRGWTRGLPDELTTMLVYLTGPDMDGIPDEVRGRLSIGVVGCHIGTAAEADRDLAVLRALPGVVDLSDRAGYLDLQQMFDAELPPGRRYYFSDMLFDELSDGLLEMLATAASQRPSPGCEFDIHHMEGAAGRVGPGATAFAGRSARFVMNTLACWDEPSEDDAHRSWVRSVKQACAPFRAACGYVNFAGDTGSADEIRDVYGPARYDRLVAVKQHWDPENLFHLNQNIRP
jgi:FAD/FMN-containing dehydrogenase